MRKILAAAATLGVASLGVIVPATGAQAASAACDRAWQDGGSGYLFAYNHTHCSGYLGKASGNDSDWGDSAGGFRGSDDNRASSVVHKGTSGMAVKFYSVKGYKGGHTCLKKSEYYMSSLYGHRFTSSSSVNDNISSHKWVWESACSKFLDS
ncbi:hypothetical protein I3F58_27785 [Streptomyces sp. MUM 203J]|uniref:hypothetical protein n=1 Tax=Streptomyces sp. MUM 203J TaxID=2791990 RepID=UPI001F04B180|nr:hypothetical protein [Streptomyces sp. MUM 203J]MCH0543284.1 hypothetical protein [Streptomyces sp. MUM 203J]